MNISLSADDFRALVRGEVLTFDGFPDHAVQPGSILIRVALADIGWDQMQGLIAQVKQEARHDRAQERHQEARRPEA